MTELTEGVRKLRDQELERACKKFGETNNSNHESYAVIKEEFEEAKDDFDKFRDWLDVFWEATKQNDGETALIVLTDMSRFAELCAAEMIQVCAMCKKAFATCNLKNRKEKEKKEEHTA